ncbi:hypothetical protein [Natronolimnohabitans innermongolicus]|uniref:Uncharacterized protein n=1 Tax=Natronolimnohabitans innermongolicus JCM 12255 TaxID=1227499 RepID=L9WI17_9EURY|nr:hypothetical protein [Natronolimnohabitans innermongolicus]ELY48886.1 hypothetical protein C493_21401 [Natronolimnohabitans innermongolicus JCM 12255]
MIDVSLGFLVSSLPWWIAVPLLQLAVLVVGMALDETYVNRTTVLMGAIATHIYILIAGSAGVLVSLYADFGLVVGAYGLYAYVIDGYVGGWFRLLAYYVYSPLSVLLVVLTAGPTVFGVEPFVVPALAGAAVANYQFREYLRPEQPFYFGPRTQEEFDAVLELEEELGDAIAGGAAGGPASGAPAADAGTNAAADGGSATDGSAPDDSSTTGSDRAAGAAAARSNRTDATTRSASGQQRTAETQRSAGQPNSTDDVDRAAADPAAAADSSERGILPEFMRRL